MGLLYYSAFVANGIDILCESSDEAETVLKELNSQGLVTNTARNPLLQFYDMPLRSLISEKFPLCICHRLWQVDKPKDYKTVCFVANWKPNGIGITLWPKLYFKDVRWLYAEVIDLTRVNSYVYKDIPLNSIYSDITDAERYHDSDNKFAKDVRFSNKQLEVIRHGIECGIDVSVYANPEIPAKIMQDILCYLKSSRYFTVRYRESIYVDAVKEWYKFAKSKDEALDIFKREMNGRYFMILDINASIAIQD